MDKRPVAWLPLTPRGVAAFAYASVGRVLVFQLFAATLTAGAVVWTLSSRWFPTIAVGIDHLPQQGVIRSGRLEWTADSPQTLSESRFISLAVDLQHTGGARSPSQLQVEFGRDDLRVYSVFGCAEIPYPKSQLIAFNAPEGRPWWGAWAPMILLLAAAAVIAGLLISWAVLATVYCLAVWLLGLYLNRELTLVGCWRLAGAALVPGALAMAAAIVGYGFARFDLVKLAAAWVFHLLLGWAYLVAAVVAAPKIQTDVPVKANPFVAPSVDAGQDQAADSKSTPHNPFSAKP